MFKRHSFKFLDDGLNRALVGLLEGADIDHLIDEGGVVHYSAGDREVVENDLICSIRDEVFSPWQILTCPGDWIAHYTDYMRRHDIPFRGELSDGEMWFLIPRKYRPHSWKLESPIKQEQLAKSKG